MAAILSRSSVFISISMAVCRNLQCISNGDATVLHLAIDSLYDLRISLYARYVGRGIPCRIQVGFWVVLCQKQASRAGTCIYTPFYLWCDHRFLVPYSYRANTWRVNPRWIDISTWWRHQMEKFCALLALCAGNSPVPGEFSHTKASDADLWCFLWSASE